MIMKILEGKIDALWQTPGGPDHYVAAMEFVVGRTDRAAEVPELAKRYAVQQGLRNYMRYKPRQITRQPVRDVEWLTTKRDPARPMILSFFHHHRYDGMFGSLKRAGAQLSVLVIEEGMDKNAFKVLRQHMKVVARGGELIPASGGTDGVVAVLKPGVVLCIASDVPGRTPVQFLGREVLGSFGAARAATLADAPVALVTSHQDGNGGNYLQIHEPLDPRSFADPADLLAEILRIQGEAVLAWPEALDFPLQRFGQVPDEPPA
jgi:lauroyl/myristoyl acyltransferase